MFIVFDGPNGVGKSTVISEVAMRLREDGFIVIETKEPTTSLIGTFIRENQDSFSGYSLAALVAADRHNHLFEEVLEKNNEGNVILCDRYIASSLILQGIDGLTFEDIMSINSGIITPDLSIFLIADSEVLEKRLSTRKHLTRFEKNFNSSLEVEYTIRAMNYLKESLNYETMLENTDKVLEETVDNIYQRIINEVSINYEVDFSK